VVVGNGAETGNLGSWGYSQHRVCRLWYI